MKACVFCILSLVFLLVGCSSNKMPSYPRSLNYGEFCSSEEQCQWVTQLRKKQVAVYFYGDQIEIIFLTSSVFKERQTQLTLKGKEILDTVAKLLSCYQKTTVKVQGYSSDLLHPSENVELSKQQAHAITRYLWKKCIKTRIIYATGGAVMPSDHNYFGQNHIIIKTQKLP